MHALEWAIREIRVTLVLDCVSSAFLAIPPNNYSNFTELQGGHDFRCAIVRFAEDTNVTASVG